MEVTSQDQGNVCRRQSYERRQPHWQGFCYAFLKSRRQHDRRLLAGEVQNYYSDRYGTSTLIAAIAMMLLCIADTSLTLLLVERGASELNPFIAVLLKQGTLWFFALKYVLTAVCVFTLVVHTRIGVFGMRGYHLLLFAILCYSLLVHYQVAMLLQ